jgi:hypothetical protein
VHTSLILRDLDPRLDLAGRLPPLLPQLGALLVGPLGPRAVAHAAAHARVVAEGDAGAQWDHADVGERGHARADLWGILEWN